MSEKHESEMDPECTECGYVHPDDAQCDEWIAGEWECARCNTTVQLDDGLDMPRHRMCHPCATAALDEVIAAHQETLRQLAEVTAERDAAQKTLDEADEAYTNLGAERDALKRRVEELERDLGAQIELAEERLAWAHQLQVDIEAEQQGRLALRQRFGAREDETFGAFIERLWRRVQELQRLVDGATAGPGDHV